LQGKNFDDVHPRKGLLTKILRIFGSRKYRSKKGAALFMRNWSGKPGFRRGAPEMRPLVPRRAVYRIML
jgi:hypothetical protein